MNTFKEKMFINGKRIVKCLMYVVTHDIKQRVNLFVSKSFNTTILVRFLTEFTGEETAFSVLLILFRVPQVTHNLSVVKTV